MKMKVLLLACALIASSTVFSQSQPYQWKSASSGGYNYKYVTNDPSKARFYTLKNGLTVVLSQNNKKPVIYYRAAVRAGSNTDPKHATGLAHYLEHLLFKGTDKFGTMDYAKEKPLLDKIDALYEQYNKTTDPAKRKEIYAEIDKTSGEASNYSIANEYDKIMTSIGGQTTNAHTWYEETVYKEDFPSNATDKFLALQAERFRNPVFRLFHTELETVYEEKNRSLDNDNSKMFEQVLAALFPTHNYGQQSTIGVIEHLKNPSLVEIRKYYNKYYVPNNMIIAMAGDLNPDEMIKKIDASFAYMKAKPVDLYNPAPEKPLTSIQQVEILGPNAESVGIFYRGFAENTREAMLLDLVSSILSNGKAGLLDINLNKQQQVLRSDAGTQQMKDYGFFMMSAQPKQGQTLDQARDLLLAQLQKVKNGEFDESLIPAIVANTKLKLLTSFEENEFRVEALTNEFILNRGVKWDKSLASTDDMGKVTKAEITAFAKRFFADNYVVAYKRKGEDKNVAKVDKPQITPVKTNSEFTSPLAKTLIGMPVKPIQPQFLDYKKDLQFGKAGIADVITVENKDNSLFRLTYRFDLGSWNNQLLPYAAQYLSYLGTDKYTSEEISKQFYTIACSYNFAVANEEASITVTGLQENYDKAVTLVEHIFANCQPNDNALAGMKSAILKNRENAKLNKGNILNGLVSYAQYGASNPFNHTLTNEQVSQITSRQLIDLLHNIKNYQHTITYYGPQALNSFVAGISKLHPVPATFTAAAPAKQFSYSPATGQVFFADYDMVQAEVRWVRNAGVYDPTQTAHVDLFNGYFGGGMGSVVFQTIRESKALAYSTYAGFSSPDKKDKQYMMMAYVGTQADKMNDALTGMNELLTTLPESSERFAAAKDNAVNSLETERITQYDIISSYLRNKKLGIDHDARIELYKGLKPLTFADINAFHQKNVSNKPYNYCVVASKNKVTKEDLAKYGAFTQVSLEQIFGF